MEILDLGWWINKKLKEELGTCPYHERCVLNYRSQILMTSFLHETKHLEISNYRNYKTIGPEMKEL